MRFRRKLETERVAKSVRVVRSGRLLPVASSISAPVIKFYTMTEFSNTFAGSEL